MFSDSSSDSDSGIRFKTTSTRQVEDKQTSGRSSPRTSQRPNNSYERRHDRSTAANNKYRMDDDRRSRRHDDRKSSPGHNYRRKESTRDEKSHYRDSDRSRSRQDSNRFRSPLNRNGSRRRSISDDRRQVRRETDDLKSSSSLDLKSVKDVSGSKHSERKRIENTANKSNSSDRLSVKENSNKNRNIIVEEDANEKQLNISKTRTKLNLKDNLVQSTNNTNKNKEENMESPKKHDHTVNDKDNNHLLTKNSKGKETPTRINEDGASSSLEQHNKELKTKSRDEKSGKNKTKKPKHSKHGKKHKKEKLDLSEGELTPSDNDICFNDSELDRTSPGRKTITKSNVNASCRRPIGPEIPKELRGELEHGSVDVIEISDSGQVSTDEDTYGPLPTSCVKMTKAHLELEERAIKLRMDKLQEHDVKDEKNRDEWMLELPDVQAAHLGLGPRKFRAREGPDMSDRSSWTDTPKTKGIKCKETESEASKRIAEEAHRLRIQEKDAKQEKLIKKHKKKHKREESLLELHQKKLRKKKKKEKDAGLNTERRRFDRDIDLGVNRFDEAQKKSIFKKAQLLDTRFSQGESKFL